MRNPKDKQMIVWESKVRSQLDVESWQIGLEKKKKEGFC